MRGALITVGSMMLCASALADSEQCGQGDSAPCPVAPVEISGSGGLMNVGYTLGVPGNGAITTPSESGTIGGVSIAQIMSTYKPPCAGAANSPVPADYFANVLADCKLYVRTFVPWYQLVSPYNTVGLQIDAACQPAANGAYQNPPRVGSGRCKE